MRRSSIFYLAKIQEMVNYLVTQSTSHSRDEYLGNQSLQFAVERAFITLGEAMGLLKKHEIALYAELEIHAASIGFRNFLIHRYWDIDSREVWSTLIRDMPPLKVTVDALIKRLERVDE